MEVSGMAPGMSCSFLTVCLSVEECHPSCTFEDTARSFWSRSKPGARGKLIWLPELEASIQIMDCNVLNHTTMYPVGLHSKLTRSQAVPLLRGVAPIGDYPSIDHLTPGYTRHCLLLDFDPPNDSATQTLPFWIPKSFGLISIVSFDLWGWVFEILEISTESRKEAFRRPHTSLSTLSRSKNFPRSQIKPSYHHQKPPFLG